MVRGMAVATLVVAMMASAAGAQVISEFMAVNHSTMMDEDSEFNDWIEIWNPGAASVNLDGWYLTDDAADRTKWQFPAITLESDAYRLVFASRKDRTDPLGELHTNFKLQADGEYLALVMPDGMTVAHAYSPAYPPQIPDTPYTYGLSPVSGALVAFDIPTPGAANIPEPATLSLLALGGLALVRGRRRPAS